VGSPGVQPISNPQSMTPVNDRRRCEIIQDPKSQVTLHSFLLRLPCPRPLEALANIVDVWRTRYPNLYFTLTFSLCYLALACPPCICGHSEAAHALAQRVTYPPRGRCVDSGCIGFQTVPPLPTLIAHCSVDTCTDHVSSCKPRTHSLSAAWLQTALLCS
jgi:hypothetical protein